MRYRILRAVSVHRVNSGVAAVKFLVVALILLLAILHQDFWWWDSKELVFGFMPIGLAWHTGLSLAAGIVGWIAVLFCWPKTLDEEDGDGSSSLKGGAA